VPPDSHPIAIASNSKHTMTQKRFELEANTASDRGERGRHEGDAFPDALAADPRIGSHR
jgi:hypothetical protein